MPGPRPQATAIRMLKGNPSKEPLPEREPTAPPAELTPPVDLSGEALAEWQRVAPVLRASGLLTQLDPSALRLYCEAWAEWVDARKRLDAGGLIVLSPNGYPMPSPYVRMQATAFERVRKMLVEFGMTPSARSRVKADALPEPGDPFEEFADGVTRPPRRTTRR